MANLIKKGLGISLKTISKAAAPAISAAQRAIFGAADRQANATEDLNWFWKVSNSTPPPTPDPSSSESRFQWVFLGCPGVGKGTYASRLAKLLEIPHISMGDLVRNEVKRQTTASAQLSAIINKGQLVPDDIIFGLLSDRLTLGKERGEAGYILDGFPRTVAQAMTLEQIADINLVLNLRLREDVLIRKCIGRRICGECGGNFNVADIFEPAQNGVPEIVMPPLSPPPQCESKMTIRADDTEEIVRRRLDIFRQESQPIEDFYRERKLLADFEISGGIPETWPRLCAALNLDDGRGDEEAVLRKVA